MRGISVIKTKLLMALSVAVILVSAGGYATYRHDTAYVATTDESCLMPDMNHSSTAGQSSAVATKTIQQDPNQNPNPNQDNSFDDFVPAQAPEDDKHCERPNPNGSNPDQGGQDPKKVGCKCVRKLPCTNGNPVEDTKCKRHCKPNQCDCPDPCKT